MCGGVTRQHQRYEVRAGSQLELDGSTLSWRKDCGAVLSEGAAPDSLPRILILTPVKGSARHLERYFGNLRNVSYPPSRLSLAFLVSDDAAAAKADSDRALLLQHRPAMLEHGFARVDVYGRDYGYQMPHVRA